MMESDLGKLFIGGISWETDEERLREYFESFGEVVECVVMKDRTTMRARGFGFIVFADPAVAELVVKEKHTIDGRLVEAKKAVPRDEQRISTRNIADGYASPAPGPARTKKIFVGGLPSTVTEAEFKKYFDQFGDITDVVVMYDHQTQRPRGFGFVTFDSEEAVDKALFKTFHELNGKMVEVKRAVPRELIPGPPARSPVVGYNHSLNRVGSIVNGYTQGYNMSSFAGYGARLDGRFRPLVSGGRTGFGLRGSGNSAIGMNLNPSLHPFFPANMRHSISTGNFLNGNFCRFRISPGYHENGGATESSFTSNGQASWRNAGFNTAAFLANSGTGNISGIGNTCINWGNSSSNNADQDDNCFGYNNGHLDSGNGKNNYGVVGSTYRRSTSTGDINRYNSRSYPHEGAYAALYEGGLLQGVPTWQSASSDLSPASPFSYDLDAIPSENVDRVPAGFNSGNYRLDGGQDRGIAA